jgi:hypothetical protein
MFILKRQDVDINSVQNPTKDQKIPILTYQGQTFRLLSVFSAAQEDEARALWRDLTDHRGKICVLLEEPDRYSVWGRIRLDTATMPAVKGGAGAQNPPGTPACIRACLLIMQALRDDIGDLLGDRQIKRFVEELVAIGAQQRLPEAGTPQSISKLMSLDPLVDRLPPWQETHLTFLLQELHRIGRLFFGRANFTGRVLDALEELSDQDRTVFLEWLKRSPSGELWQEH